MRRFLARHAAGAIVLLLIGLAAVPSWVVIDQRPRAGRLPPGPVMIAHALDTVDRIVYTNSREAFAESLQRGFRWFEIDLAETVDGQLVACHTLGPLQRELGSAARIGEMTHRQYMSARPYRRYTPLDLSAIWISSRGIRKFI